MVLGTSVVVGVVTFLAGATIYILKKCTKSDKEPELNANETQNFAQLKKDAQVTSVEALVDGKEKKL